MKKSDKENEQIMKQILENQEIEFQDSDWEAAQMLIQNANLSAPKKRRRFGLWIFFCVFSLGMSLFYFGMKENFSDKNITLNKKTLTETQNPNISPNENIRDSKSTISKEKEEISTPNIAKSEANVFAKNPIQIANSINSSIQKNRDNNKNESFLAENKSPNLAEKEIFLEKTKETNLVSKNNKIITENIENQLSKAENTLSQNTTFLPQHKVWEIEKPENRLNTAFHSPQNIPILPDFPAKNNRFSLQIFGGAASTLAANTSSKPTFYGGLQTSYQIHKNCKLLLFSELSSRNSQFKNNNISSMNMFPDEPINHNLDFQSICESIPSVSNVLITSQTRINRNLIYYAGVGAGISLPYKRHEFSLTSSFQKVIQTRSDYELLMFENGNLIYQENKKINKFTEGLNKQDVTFSIAYQYLLNRNLQLQVSGTFGTQDMSNNTYYGNQIKDRNMQIRAGIAYRFWH